MSSTVPFEEADAKQLREYARTVLNIEVAQTENSASLRAKIAAVVPDITAIPLGPTPTAAAKDPVQQVAIDLAPKPKPTADGKASAHFSHDPRVELMILPSSDPTRPKEVQIGVNDDVIMIQRGKKVRIPYRHYLVLNDAIESIAIDTDEVNPITHMPIKEWVEQHSYPFQVFAMPRDEEIAAWEKRTAKLVAA